MGGLLQGLGSALGGAGAAAGPYREHVLDRWAESKKQILDLASQELANARDPIIHANLLKGITGLAQAVPGTKLDGHLKSIFEAINVHPDTHALMQQHGIVDKPPAAPETKPAAPPPGMTPGTGLGQTLMPPKEGSAAQPASNPTQPWMGPSPLAMPAVAPAAAPASAAPSAVPDIQPMPQAAAPAVAPLAIPAVHQPTSEEIDALEGGTYHKQAASGYVTPGESKAHEHFAAGHATLAEKKAADKYLLREYGPERLKFFQSMPGWKDLPTWQQFNLAAQSIGEHGITMPGVMMSRELVSPLVRKADLQPDWQVEGDSDYYRVERDRMDGKYHAVPTVFRPDETPHAMPTAAGGQTFIKPSEAKKGGSGTAIPGVVAPSMLGTERSTSTQQLPEGGSRSTVQAHKVIPGAAPVVAAGEPRPKGLPQISRPFNPSDRTDYIVAAIGRDSSNWKMATNAADKHKIGKRMAELGIDPNNVTGSMRERAGNARLVLGHLDDVNNIINEADKAGELGIVASRWNDFLSGKLGADPTPGQVFTKLSSNLSFLSTAVAMAHGGLRGGGSPQMVEHWEKALFAKDAATLRQKLAQAYKWMEGYAGLVPKESLATKPPQSSQIHPVGVPEVGSSFGGGKVISVKRID